jgi:hypothetical protein|tara:strand:- start:7137 stop:7493 length:357 start_codon:yes stop_codon:yes gene_type:complete
MTLKKLTPHKRRQALIGKLVDVPATQKKFFWAREMKLLKDLEARYSLGFLEIATFPKKYDSLAYLVSKELKSTMDKKWRNFNFKVDLSKYDSIVLGEKTGKDYIPSDNKPKNTKDLFK